MTFNQLYNLVLEQSNPVLPVNLPSPEEKAQKQQAFQQQQQKSVQDVKDVGLAAFEVAKFFDPSGILSWGDVKAAYDAFVKSTKIEDQTTNGLALTLAIGSVIPIYGKATYPVKAAVKAGRTAEVAGLLGPLINKIRGVLKDTNLLRTHGIDARQLDNAFQTVNRNRNKINVPYRDTRTGQIIDPRTDPQVYRKQTDVPQQRPVIKQFNGNIVQRNFYPNVPKNSKGERELAKKMDLKAEELRRAADGYGWNDSFAKEIKVLDRQNYHNRDVIEIDIPFEEGRKKILMYKSYKGTSGKQQGYWYPILGFTDSWFIKSDGGINLTEYSSPFFKGLAEYLLRYGPEGLR